MKSKLEAIRLAVASLPGSLLGVLLCAVLTAASFGQAAGPARGVAAALQPYVDSHALAGAVLLWADKDRVLGLETVGYADVPKAVPMRADALFWIASMSKPLTATALMMLVDEGKVKLSDPVEKYLPEFRGQWLAIEQDADHQLLRKPARPITVEDVLSHTSGLPFMSRVEQKIDTYPLATAVLTYALSPLKFQPGSKYDYSNAGINTAGRIIEVVSGLPYQEFLARRLFRPLGMKDTTLWPSPGQLQRLVRSYKPNANGDGLEEIPISQLTYPLDRRSRGPSPAGGFFSTAQDLSLFCRMLLNGGVYGGRRYVSEAAVKEMTSNHTGEMLGKDGNGYGLGFGVGGRPHGGAGLEHTGTFGHGGAYSTDMQIDAQHQLITIYLVQHAGYAGKNGGNIVPDFRKAALAAAGR
jgi:CubicO group peptidase (beta-lactamase class C family)